MTIPHISPQQAAELLSQGALLIDIREADEHAREHIPNAKLVPLSQLPLSQVDVERANAVIFHCRSGSRTKTNVEKLAGAVACRAYVLDGGLEAWKKAGLPVRLDRRKPLELMRQVQIAAGSLVLLGVLLGVAIHPAFYALSGLVGAGLTFAGISGFCGLARVLAAMPWNAPRDAPEISA